MAAGSWINELKAKKIWISDIGTNPKEIDILIGADRCGKLLTGKILQLKNGLTAVETILGWTIMGELQEEPHRGTSAMTVADMFVSSASVEELWSLEAIGIQDPSAHKSKEEKEAETREHFLNTVSRSADGRYTVSLPWIDGKKEIPGNKSVAMKRLENMTRKLKLEGKYDIYDHVFNSWLEEGIIEEVPLSEIEKPAHYLPHRAVFKESVTTPVRPVFDASCKIGRSPSLNDCLEKGPNLLEEIPAILTRFREGKIGVTSDIRKAFLMIEIEETDRDYLRFIWWDDLEKNRTKIFRHKRVVFGVNCSPFLLGAVIEYHLKNFGEEIMADKLLKSLYVDNCVTSVNSVEEYVKFKETSTELLSKAGMELRLWQSSCGGFPRVGPYLGCGLGMTTEETTLCPQPTSVLGLLWDMEKDTISCDVSSITRVERVTKRIILSTAQKIYDPLGILCPVLLFPKKMLQEMWEEKLGWDEDVDEETASRFTEWFEELDCLNQVKISRNVTGGNQDRKNWQLHTFCDASIKAYASVVFLRTEKNGEVSVQLLQAKSRVAPLEKPGKKTSICRLELLGCTIAARLATSVKKSLELEEIPQYYWSDSTTALAWVKRNDEWGTFVGNRVREICSLTKTENWRYVPGVLNPADLPSRGCTAQQLLKSKWWLGPDWLKKDEKEWPSECGTVDEDSVTAEKKKSSVGLSIGLLSTVGETPWYAKNYSSYRKTIRVMSWVRRFIFNKINKQSPKNLSPNLSVAEMRETEEALMLLVQKEVFPSKGEIIDGIRIEREKNGLIRVITKITNRNDTGGFRRPLLLPNSHPFVDMMITEAHEDYGRTGVKCLLAKIRENFWILRGRRAIKKIIVKCVKCRRFAAKKENVIPAPLPVERVSDVNAFTVTGVDLAGPLFLKKKEKVWVVLFTCAVYRCVHLELVRSLSTEDFLDAFSRFTDRRGRPSIVYSDNGTNFVGAVNLFRKIDWKKVERVSSMKKIQWRFNPPSAPWWGGFWERLVRTMKDLLKRILGRASVTFEKLSTIICAIEAYINGRPLTTITEDSEDLIPLTPAYFLQELPTTAVSELDFLNTGGLRENYQMRKNIVDEFKMRFRKEYLSLLVQRGKEKKIRDFCVGEVVLVGDDNKRRWQWPMAKIIQLMPGRDGNTRMAQVKTANGILLRPIQRLYPLEILPENPKTDDDGKVLPPGKPPSGNKDSGKFQPTIWMEPTVEKKLENVTRSGRTVKTLDRLHY